MARPDALALNDRLAGTALAGDGSEALDFVCECGRVGCSEVVQLSLPTFTWARRRGLSVLRLGHDGKSDTVVESTRTFVLVRRRAG